ncbi:hypothetical protein BGZ98_001150 [Dissophora globulifera]|nr:hypothetical protein BGZ98_001150 [Dissophora globulifera]
MADQPCIPLYQQRILTPPPSATLPASAAASQSSSRFATPSSSPSPAYSISFTDTSSQQPTFQPRATLRGGSSADHTSNVQKLLAFQECCRKSEFWEESAILERLYYKNKSQHRQSGHFQRLCECRRLVSRIKELDIAGLTDELVKKFFSGRSLKTLAATKSQWDSVPYRSTVAYTMTRIIGGILLLRKLQYALHETYGAFYQLMSKAQFMAFALITIGLCSRLSIVSKAWTNELADGYELLGAWIKSFPKENNLPEAVDYEKQLPESINSLMATTVPSIPATPVPAAVSQPMEDSDMGQVVQRKGQLSTSKGSDVGLDLGQVVQRKDLPKASSPIAQRSSTPSSSESSGDELERRVIETKQDADNNSNGNDDAHKGLLDELDTIFGSKPAPVAAILNKSKTDKAKAGSPLPDLDSIFGSAQKQKTKGKDGKKPMKHSDSIASLSSSPSSSSTPSTPGQKTSLAAKGTQARSASNFDDVFNLSRSASPSSSVLARSQGGSVNKHKSTTEMDDIFATASKKPKKKKLAGGSEIDQIFGPPSKKKMKGKER